MPHAIPSDLFEALSDCKEIVASIRKNAKQQLHVSDRLIVGVDSLRPAWVRDLEEVSAAIRSYGLRPRIPILLSAPARINIWTHPTYAVTTLRGRDILKAMHERVVEKASRVIKLDGWYSLRRMGTAVKMALYDANQVQTQKMSLPLAGAIIVGAWPLIQVHAQTRKVRSDAKPIVYSDANITVWKGSPPKDG